MIVQHIIWFLFNFHPKIPKFRFFSFFSENGKFSEIFHPKSKRRASLTRKQNNIIFAIIKSFER